MEETKKNFEHDYKEAVKFYKEGDIIGFFRNIRPTIENLSKLLVFDLLREPADQPKALKLINGKSCLRKNNEKNCYEYSDVSPKYRPTGKGLILLYPNVYFYKNPNVYSSNDKPKVCIRHKIENYAKILCIYYDIASEIGVHSGDSKLDIGKQACGCAAFLTAFFNVFHAENLISEPLGAFFESLDSFNIRMYVIKNVPKTDKTVLGPDIHSQPGTISGKQKKGGDVSKTDERVPDPDIHSQPGTISGKQKKGGDVSKTDERVPDPDIHSQPGTISGRQKKGGDVSKTDETVLDPDTHSQSGTISGKQKKGGDVSNKEQVAAQGEMSDKNNFWQTVSFGSVAALICSAGVTMYANNNSRGDKIPLETSVKPDLPEAPVESVESVASQTTEAPDNDGVQDPVEAHPLIVDDNIAIASSVDDHMSFSEAFVAARSEVGGGGVFEWRGNLYNTYTAEEWNAMNVDEKASYNEHFAWADQEYNEYISDDQDVISQEAMVASDDEQVEVLEVAHNEDSNYNFAYNEDAPDEQDVISQEAMVASDDVQVEVLEIAHNEDSNYDVAYNEDAPDEQDVISQEPMVASDDVQVEVLGIAHNEDLNMNYGRLAVDGQQAMVVDVNGDMVFDALVVDSNADGYIQDDNVVDISEENLTVEAFGGFTEPDMGIMTSPIEPIDDADYIEEDYDI